VWGNGANTHPCLAPQQILIFGHCIDKAPASPYEDCKKKKRLWTITALQTAEEAPAAHKVKRLSVINEDNFE